MNNGSWTAGLKDELQQFIAEAQQQPDQFEQIQPYIEKLKVIIRNHLPVNSKRGEQR